jgi:lysozyme
MVPEKLRKPLIALVISAAGIVGISKHEGTVLEAYKPLSEDIWTIGTGTTVHPDGTKVQQGDKITRQQAEDYLRHDLGKFAVAMQKCIKVPVSQNEYDAFISLTYNIGSNAFCNSTLVKKLNAYDYAGACKEILRWDKFGNPPRPLNGLTKRRQDEYQLCVK